MLAGSTARGGKGAGALHGQLPALVPALPWSLPLVRSGAASGTRPVSLHPCSPLGPVRLTPAPGQIAQTSADAASPPRWRIPVSGYSYATPVKASKPGPVASRLFGRHSGPSADASP